MIRILHSVSNMDRAGIETMLMNYYRYMDKSKVQFDFLCNKKKPGAYDDEIKSMGGRIYHTPGLNPAKYPVYLKYMRGPRENHLHGIFVLTKKENKAMKEKIYDARTGMEYSLVGNCYLPALKLPRTRPIGRWGMLHKAYLKLRKPAYYQSLLLSGKLDAVLADVEEHAAERYEVLIEQMSQREGISEKLKEENQMEWVRRMSNLENRAAEIVKTELIYTFERR